MRESLQQIWLVVILAAVLGGVLAAVDRGLQPRIADHALARLQQAITQVVPDGDTFQTVKATGVPLYRVTRPDGELAGWAVLVEGRGFVDKLQALVGLSPDAETIVGLAVLSSRETPGLGDRIQQAEFTDQFTGKPAARTLSVARSGGSGDTTIHAVTGATISSQAITQAVNTGVVSARRAIKNYQQTAEDSS